MGACRNKVVFVCITAPSIHFMMYNGNVYSWYYAHTYYVCVVRVVASGVALDLCDCCNCKARVTSTVKVLSLFKSKHRPTQLCVRIESKAPSDLNLWTHLSVVRFVYSVSSGVALDDSYLVHVLNSSR